MAETIESFVSRLRTEGVEQGKQQADQLKIEAQKEADQILADAKARAEKIVADANTEATEIISRGQTELELAARDAVLKLREALQKAVEAVLTAPVETQLSDAGFLKELIASIMDRYIESDINRNAPVKINVSAEMQSQLSDWAMAQLRTQRQGEMGGFDLSGSLRQAGFEFTLRGATVEITRDSVVETLMQLVGPQLRQIIAAQAKGGK